MSGYSSGLVPIGKTKSGASGSSSGSRTSLADAPNVLSRTTAQSPRTKNFAHNFSDDDDDDDDLDALLQDKPVFAHRTLQNRRALDDSTNSFDDSLSSTGSPMKDLPKRHNSYDDLDTLSPLTNAGKGKDLLENTSFESDELEDSILGGIVSMGGGSGTRKSSESSSSKHSIKVAPTSAKPTVSISSNLSDSDEIDVGALLESTSKKNTFTAPSIDSRVAKHDEDEQGSSTTPSADSMGGFVPSFLDGNRRARPKRIMSSVQATDLDELDRKLGISGGGGSNRKLMTDITSHSEETMSDPVLSRARSNTPSEPLPESFEKVSEDTRPSSVGGGTGKVTFNLPHLGTSPSKGSQSSLLSVGQSTGSTNSSPIVAPLTAKSSTTPTAASASSRRNNSLTVNTSMSGSDESPQHSSSLRSKQQSPKSSEPSPRKQQTSTLNTREVDKDVGIVLSTKTVSAIAADRERDREKDLVIMSLQQKLEVSSTEHEAVERNLRLEVDSLRTRLAISSEQLLESVSGNGGTGSSSAIGMDAQSRLLRELADSKRIIVHLEQEVSRHKDEAALQALRHHEEMKYSKERAAAQLEESERLHQSEVQTIETRHDLALQALKKLHLEEITAIKERSKDNAALETLASQIRSSTGSMKLIEEQLNLRYRTAELAKEGQLEARERLIRDMEEKAKERAELAEAEAFRLKGLLMHMEQMMSTMRAQTGEDKDRLRMEHIRLQSIQTALESDRAAFQRRVEDETVEISRKSKELHIEALRVAEEKRLALRDVEEERFRLEEAKSEFATRVTASTRAVESSVARLKDEEARLTAIKEELQKERIIFQQRKEAASRELLETEMKCKAIVLSADNLIREKEGIQTAAREVQVASESLNKRDDELDQWAAELTRRERTIEKRSQDLSRLNSEVQRRQTDVETLNQVLGSQQLALVKLDHDVIQRSAEYASSQRELLRRQAKKTLAEINDDREYFETTPSERFGAKINTWIGKSDPEELDTIGTVQQSQRSFKENRAAAASSRHVYKELSSVERELALARKSLMSAKGTMGRNEEFRAKTSDLLFKETDFLADSYQRKSYF